MQKFPITVQVLSLRILEENLILKLRNFSKLSFQSKVNILKKGRPIPDLKDLLQTTGRKKVNRFFHKEWYTRKEWLCGSTSTLFSTNDNVWTKTGFCDFKNLPRSLSKHEKSNIHIQSEISFKTIGTSRIDLTFNEQRRLHISLHNSNFKENQEILKVLINGTCYLANQELAFCGNDESVTSFNRGNYVELIYAFAENDERISRHLETSTVFWFSGLSNRIQNDIIETVAEVIRTDIRKDINKASFVAVEVDETTDVTQKAQISVIFCYVCEASCIVKKAFFGFDGVSDDRRASAIAQYVLGILQKFNSVEKLVAPTYDGASVMSSELNGVQAKRKEDVPEAMFLHCYAHKLNLVLLHSAKCMPERKAFFITLEGLSALFSKTTKRTRLLDNVVKLRLPRASPTRWNSSSRLLQTVSMYHSDLLMVFRVIGDAEDKWNNDSVMKAAGFGQRWLLKTNTCFLIMAYEEIFNKTDAFFKVLQNKLMDIAFCCAQIRDTIDYLERQRQEFDSFYHQFKQKCATLHLTDTSDIRQIKDKRKQTFYNILNNIIVQLKSRFKNFSELSFLGLVDYLKFSKMALEFHDNKLQNLSEKYAKFFDCVKLKADLIGLYSSQAVKNKCKTSAQLLSLLYQNDLIQTVPEATKLLKLVLTVPATNIIGGKILFSTEENQNL